MEDSQRPDFREKLAQSFADDLEELAQKAAEAQGQPMGTRRVSDARALRMYGIRDQHFDRAALIDMLNTTGVHPDLLNPQNPESPLIIRERPDLIPYYAKPAATPEAAQALADLAEYPFRYGLVMDIDNPQERVRYATHLQTQWEASQPQPDPTPIAIPPAPVPIATAPSLGPLSAPLATPTAPVARPAPEPPPAGPPLPSLLGG